VVSALLAATGVDVQAAEEIEPSGAAMLPASSIEAWLGPRASEGGGFLRVEAGFDGARPLWVRAVPSGGPEDFAGSTGEEGDPPRQFLNLMFFGFFIGGAILALFNLRAGRWDRRGAIRLAIAAFLLCLVSMLISAHHTFTLAEEGRRTFSAVAYASTRALMTFLLYVAIEPFIRRLHPTTLVSWSRLLSGRVSNPAVGRDVLIGYAVMAAQSVVFALWWVLRGASGQPFPILGFETGNAALTAAPALAMVLRYLVVAVGSGLGYMLVYVTLRSLLGRAHRVAPVGLWLLLAMLYSGGMGFPMEDMDRLALGAILATTITFLVVRCGLLTTTIGLMLMDLFATSILTIDPTDWYFAPTAIVVCFSLGLIVFGYRTATARAPLLARMSHQG
jgi:hypothetical protein